MDAHAKNFVIALQSPNAVQRLRQSSLHSHFLVRCTRAYALVSEPIHEYESEKEEERDEIVISHFNSEFHEEAVV